MEYEINEKNKEIIIRREDGIAVFLSPEDVMNISKDVQKTFFFKEDVENQIEILIESGDLPKEALENEDYINAVHNEYASLREENEGIESPLDWTECINEAFDNIDYEDYSNDKEL